MADHRADDAGTRHIAGTTGANAAGTNAAGTNAADTKADGTNADGTNADGTNAEGTNADGNEPTGSLPSSHADDAPVSAAVAELTDENLEPERQRSLLGRLVRAQVRDRGVKDLLRPKAALQWVVDTVADTAPHIPVRDLATLRAHHDGLDGDPLAARLIRNAARSTASIGAAAGGVAAVEWAVTPALLSAPVLLAAETVAVVAIEMKLIGELHEVYGRSIEGTGTQRAVALLQAWAQRRGVNPLAPGLGVAAALGTAARKELRDRLVRRFGRNLTTLGPLLTGAAVAAYLNRRSTRSLGEQVRGDLARTYKVIEG